MSDHCGRRWGGRIGQHHGKTIMARLSGPGSAYADALNRGSDQTWGQVGHRSPSTTTFTNPLYRGADPWVVRHEGAYYLVQAGAGGQIHVFRSPTLTERGQSRVVWTPPQRGWNRAQVWAPELHRIDGRWYIYYAASDGRNVNHRMGVLEGLTDDPQGPFVDRGMLYTGDDHRAGASPERRSNRWAIDGTVLQLRDRLYFLWSGWAADHDEQHLYIAPMSDPCTVSGSRVRMVDNDCHPWERVASCRRQRGLHEAPQVLVRNGRVMVVYSCSGSWEPSYKLGMLYMDERSDPMDRNHWCKVTAPVFDGTHDVFGVGHCCFTSSPNGTEDWIVYHAKTRRWHGWSDRVVRAQPFTWRTDGLPEFVRPVSAHVPLARPSGEATAEPVVMTTGAALPAGMAASPDPARL